MQKQIVITIDEKNIRLDTTPEDMSVFETMGVLQYLHSHLSATTNIKNMMPLLNDDIEAEVQRRLKEELDRRSVEVTE